MNIKLVAVDLDGTLLNSRRELPSGFFRAVANLHERGVQVLIASGRQYFNIVKLLAPVAPLLFFASENGALLFENDRKLFESPIPPQKLDAIFEAVAATPGATPVLCGGRSAYFNNADPEAERNIRLYYEKCLTGPSPLNAAAADSIVKIAVFSPSGAAETCSGLIARFGNEFNMPFSGQNWLDIMNRGVNKGVALTALQRRLGIAPEECMAFGDYLNDREMLACTHYAYTMANAHAELLAEARLIAPSNDDEGVMRTLAEHFGPGLMR